MKLAKPTRFYDAKVEATNNYTLEQADRNNHKKDKDIEVGSAAIIITSANGTRYKVEVSDAGVLSTSVA
tara:strand:+ start:209 stop:415 length:207 start_codon:yes stop_codon:yes gene_type:complete